MLPRGLYMNRQILAERGRHSPQLCLRRVLVTLTIDVLAGVFFAFACFMVVAISRCSVDCLANEVSQVDWVVVA